MSKHEKAILSRIYKGPMPMTFTDHSDVEAIRILSGVGLIEAQFQETTRATGGSGRASSAVVTRVLNPAE